MAKDTGSFTRRMIAKDRLREAEKLARREREIGRVFQLPDTMVVTRITNDPGFVYRGVLITKPEGRSMRVHFCGATPSFNSGPRLVSNEVEAFACIDKWREEWPYGVPDPAEGRLAADY